MGSSPERRGDMKTTGGGGGGGGGFMKGWFLVSAMPVHCLFLIPGNKSGLDASTCYDTKERKFGTRTFFLTSASC